MAILLVLVVIFIIADLYVRINNAKKLSIALSKAAQDHEGRIQDLEQRTQDLEY